MSNTIDIKVPNIGDFEGVEIIEVLVATGDRIEAEQSLITLESDKAAMEVPSTHAGTIVELKVAVGEKVSQGDVIVVVEARGIASAKATEPPPASEPVEAPSVPKTEPPPPPKPAAPPPPSARAPEQDAAAPRPAPTPAVPAVGGPVPHASPSIRRFARELGVDLGRVAGTGRKGRILKEDVQGFVKQVMAGGAMLGEGYLKVAPLPREDFAKYGEIEIQPLSRIKKISAPLLQRNWVTIPHVTQNDEADITDLEAFRKDKKDDAAKQNIKLTMVSFLAKASAVVLKEFPQFNASLDESGENLVLKKYYHIGFAVDTKGGLVVPVIRDVDKKGIFDIARELGELSQKARDGKLSPGDMKGGCFSISSLGGIGGTSFTPIVNAPEVAILGVSRSRIKPMWDGKEFQPRLMLPLSLSYDHRVVDGASAARFAAYLADVLSDIRAVLL